MRFVFVSLIAFLVLSNIAMAAHPAAGPNGLWLTENQRSVIQVEACKDNHDLLCGHIHWIIKDGMAFDSKNPDSAKQKNPMCGLQLMGGFKQQDAMNWIDGKIYKADEGDTYDATIQLLPMGKMLVRGHIGMPLFGKSQTWTPVSGKDYPRCKPAKG